MIAPHADLRGARVLILEDDFYLATDLQAILEAAGATVMGPFSDVEQARSALADARPDCAFVDVNLGQGPTFELPSALAELSVPFAFITGYDAGTIPAEFGAVRQIAKPVEDRWIAAAARDLIDGAVSPRARAPRRPMAGRGEDNRD